MYQQMTTAQEAPAAPHLPMELWPMLLMGMTSLWLQRMKMVSHGIIQPY